MAAIICRFLLGLAAGMLSGLIGIGGGILIVPALVFYLGFTQREAQVTTLAMLVPPIGILAAWTYYRNGDVHVGTAAYIAIGFFFGGLVGARAATGVSNTALEKVFGLVLLVVAVRIIFGRP